MEEQCQCNSGRKCSLHQGKIVQFVFQDSPEYQSDQNEQEDSDLNSIQSFQLNLEEQQAQKKDLEEQLQKVVQSYAKFQSENKEIADIVFKLTKEKQENEEFAVLKNQTIEHLNNIIFKIQPLYENQKIKAENILAQQGQFNPQEMQQQTEKRQQDQVQKEMTYQQNIEKLNDQINNDDQEIKDLNEEIERQQEILDEIEEKLEQYENLNILLDEKSDQNPICLEDYIKDEQKKKQIIQVIKNEMIRNKDIKRVGKQIKDKLDDSFGGKWNVLIHHEETQNACNFSFQDQNYLSISFQSLKFTLWSS